jgi:hypothetical protein
MLVSPSALEGSDENRPNFILNKNQQGFLLFGSFISSLQVLGA